MIFVEFLSTLSTKKKPLWDPGTAPPHVGKPCTQTGYHVTFYYNNEDGEERWREKIQAALFAGVNVGRGVQTVSYGLFIAKLNRQGQTY